jgi:hypothetical protein
VSLCVFRAPLQLVFVTVTKIQEDTLNLATNEVVQHPITMVRFLPHLVLIPTTNTGLFASYL